MKPTPVQYTAFQQIYDYFNRALFRGNLPDVILNFTRQSQTAGYFAPVRWKAATIPISFNDSTRADPATRHEIAVHPSCLCRGKQEFVQTLVHEMVHLWQHEFGHPSLSTYHNQEWADKMESVGLMPSSTGQPGGKRTGQHMRDYLLPSGKLAQALEQMPESLWLPFDALEFQALDVSTLQDMIHDIEAAEQQGNVASWQAGEVASVRQTLEEVKQQKLKKRKTKYTCIGCNTNIWGKPGVRAQCEDCGMPFLPVS